MTVASTVYASSLQTVVLGYGPTASVNLSQFCVQVVAASHPTFVRASQLQCIVVWKIDPVHPVNRVWTYDMDGHSFYVLNLNNQTTLVYDVSTGQWHVRGDQTTDYWNISDGKNWVAGQALGVTYGSNVICGDPSNGAIYFLNPTYPYDDDKTTGATDKKTFQRVGMASIAFRGPTTMQCYGVSLSGDFGFIDALGIDMQYSDDGGQSWTDAGTINTAIGNYNERFEWRSLGLMTYPGRMFQIIDSGAITRIDGLELLNADGTTAQ